jgi:hypothetical protein
LHDAWPFQHFGGCYRRTSRLMTHSSMRILLCPNYQAMFLPALMQTAVVRCG